MSLKSWLRWAALTVRGKYGCRKVGRRKLQVSFRFHLPTHFLFCCARTAQTIEDSRTYPHIVTFAERKKAVRNTCVLQLFCVLVGLYGVRTTIRQYKSCTALSVVSSFHSNQALQLFYFPVVLRETASSLHNFSTLTRYSIICSFRQFECLQSFGS